MITKIIHSSSPPLPPPLWEDSRFHEISCLPRWWLIFQRSSWKNATMSIGGNVSSSELIVSKIDGPLLNLLIDEQDDANPPLHRYYCAMMAPFRHFVSSHVCTGTESLQRCSKFLILKIERQVWSCVWIFFDDTWNIIFDKIWFQIIRRLVFNELDRHNYVQSRAENIFSWE